MADRTTLYDRDHNILAIATIEQEGNCYWGTVDTAEMPADRRWTFERYEKLVNDQVHSMLDVVQDEITRLNIVSVTDDGVITALEDVRLLPKAGKISFRAGVQLTYPTI